MTSFDKKPNNVALQNNDEGKLSNIVKKNKQDKSDSSDTVKTETSYLKARIRGDSDYSFAKDTDGSLPSGGLPNSRDKLYRDKNIWVKDTNREGGPGQPWHGQDISSSNQTNHSYAVIQEPEATQNAKPRKKSNRCRIIQIVVVLVVLAILGVIAYFILSNILSKGKCGNPPSVENGHINETGNKEATVYCNSGHGTGNNQKITCGDNGKWDPIVPCKLSGCGEFPNIQNGELTGADTKLNSTAKLHCNNGFMANYTVHYRCLLNGSWGSDNEAQCFPHPCGPYTLPDNVKVSEDLSHINMTVTLQCDEGFDFNQNSDKHIKCANNSWVGSPQCEIPGLLTMETTNSPVNVADLLSISCHLSDYDKWQTVLISKSDLTNDSSPEPLFSVTNGHDDDITEKRYGTNLFQKEVSTFDDGVLVILSFSSAQCDETGKYTCSVIVGNIQSPIDLKTTEKVVKVIDTSSEVTEIKASASHVQGDEISVLCKGLIGIDGNGNKLGEIVVRIYWDESNNKNITSVNEATRHIGCHIEETVKATFVATNDMHGAELQCIFRSNDESHDKKSILLNVTRTEVQISISSSVVNIGNSLNISSNFDHIRGWNTIELRKNCSGTEIALFTIRANETGSNFTSEDHIILTKSDINNTKAFLEYHFTSLICSDACWKGSDIQYISTVKIGDTWIQESEIIEIRMDPSVPVLSVGQDSFYRGQEAILKCTGNIGIPKHNMRITENGTVQLKPPSTTKVVLIKETCENIETITFKLEVNDELNGNAYQCETYLTNGTKLLSNEEIVSVSNAILYFTEESKTGIEGSSKTIQCVLTEMANVTKIIISRYLSEEQLCEVDVTGNGSCTKSLEFSIDGDMSENMTIFTTTMTINIISCSHNGLFSCKTVGQNTLKTSMEFQVTVPATEPVLRLPTTIVENQQSEWEDRFNCTAKLGYPAQNMQLKIQIKQKDSSTFNDYPKYFAVARTETCTGNDTIDERQHVFKPDMNGSFVRCVIVNERNAVIKSSVEKEVRILKNICLTGNAGEYDPHPYNCSRYIRCVGDRLYDIQCAVGSCSLADTDPICNSYSCSQC